MLKKKSQQHKAKYTAYVACSIDGRISLSSNTLPTFTSKEDWEFFQKALSKADAVISGHNTYKVAKERLDKRNTFVLTSKVKTIIEKGNVKFINPKYVDLKKLFSKYKSVAIVGGAHVYQSMLSLGLIDEIYVTIEPVILGRGKEMFIDGKKNTNLKLISTKKLNKKGTMLLRYKVSK